MRSKNRGDELLGGRIVLNIISMKQDYNIPSDETLGGRTSGLDERVWNPLSGDGMVLTLGYSMHRFGD